MMVVLYYTRNKMMVVPFSRQTRKGAGPSPNQGAPHTRHGWLVETTSLLHPPTVDSRKPPTFVSPRLIPLQRQRRSTSQPHTKVKPCFPFSPRTIPLPNQRPQTSQPHATAVSDVQQFEYPRLRNAPVLHGLGKIIDALPLQETRHYEFPFVPYLRPKKEEKGKRHRNKNHVGTVEAAGSKGSDTLPLLMRRWVSSSHLFYRHSLFMFDACISWGHTGYFRSCTVKTDIHVDESVLQDNSTGQQKTTTTDNRRLRYDSSRTMTPTVCHARRNRSPRC